MLAAPAMRARLGATAPLAPARGARRAARSTAARPVLALQHDQLQAALAHQLRQREAAAAAEPQAEHAPRESLIPKRKTSRREEAASAAAAKAAHEAEARAHSAAAQEQLRHRCGTLEDAALQAALRMQLKQSGTFDDAEPEPEPEHSQPAAAAEGEHSAEGVLRRPRRPGAAHAGNGNGASNGASSNGNGNGNGAGHAAVVEDGAVLFTF